ncbi:MULTISPECIES: YebC/PmpR family DNA-binding transcriptional regulator [Peptostreptococcus]|jgi:YebC/PmpR family DNA-binding regulatory protein|uniref:Probable transcriptional regulatory protein HMPREF0631_0117 n=2 Tax=Peptostreptococcus anaerobius TaxID=1261 RepID=D3MQQ0_9FIRM|nr:MULTISPECIES: YebC/PmpR family DNA-binding transcriptional regulator [Peptostreptococcus]EFD05550.1 DNA-binding regulatory protein, YebC/PmpR family [Peptostreptococcus anaerobius 653-L]EKX90768.1 DNA-binding regulatory protein, YebC/PmpR family [Peptostreptococcus anaerobius VPI 4330 = DSM 2949]KXI10649.1 DNA-binding regulatory protein, YebC/PmpR family [Peptostreptococcus anaerobius]MDB8850109.1 YebC/PmpR family DNA-binding transcriptional regulator [Peptostreptococcus anaerobius]MDB88516
MGRIHNIEGRKNKQDAARSNVFTKHARAIAVAAREGGGDPEYNASLKAAIVKAKSDNMPNDNIDRAIKKGVGGGDGENYESITYEGYGAGGVAIIVETLTDNKNRTAGNVRYYFDKNNGNLGTPGCVSFMFDRKGQIFISNENAEEEQLMEEALELGAEDFIPDEDGFEIITSPEDFNAVRDGLEEKGYEFVAADVKLLPQTTSVVDDEGQVKSLEKLLDILEDDDDVQKVHHNWEMPDVE